MGLLKDKVILITGSAGLIGRGFTSSVIEEGGMVVIADIDFDNAFKFHNEVSEQFGNNSSLPVFIDINDIDSIRDVIEKVHKSFGKIDALVNNAYPRNEMYGRHFMDVEKKDFDENVSMHLGGYFLMCQQIIKYFINQGYGNIVNVASIYGCIAPKFEIYDGTEMTAPVEYAVIKSALIHLTKYMSKYVKGMNIRINCISPGGILAGQPQNFLKAYKDKCINKGMLEVKDLCGTLIYLLSEMSRYVNGQNVIVDDGFTT